MAGKRWLENFQVFVNEKKEDSSQRDGKVGAAWRMGPWFAAA
jgi:hypothetical protein